MGRGCQPVCGRIFSEMYSRIAKNSAGVAFMSSRPWTQMSLATSEAAARHTDLGHGPASEELPGSLICLLGWGQGLCEGGLCSDRLWALPPVPRQIYFKAKLHPSFRPFPLQTPLWTSSCATGLRAVLNFDKERSFMLFIC